MKTSVLLWVSIVVPAFLFGQGTVQKQTGSQSSGQSYQKQTGSYNVQPVQQTNTMQVQQQVQPTYQQQPIQQTQSYSKPTYQSQSSSHVGKYEKSTVNNANKPRVDASRNSTLATGVSGYLSINNTIKDYKDGNKSFLMKRNTESKPKPVIISYKDSSSVQTPDGTITSPIKYDIPDLYAYKVSPPTNVCRVTPAIRLYCINGNRNNLCTLDGYGVWAGAYKNYNYCLSVAKWLKKKYMANAFIFEDISYGIHYHLVFGYWKNHYLALIFQGKIRKDIPYAYIVRWTDYFNVIGVRSSFVTPQN
ncbi:MAG: hypothetical protein WCQ95_03065 [Bacteroidota bacterium]